MANDTPSRFVAPGRALQRRVVVDLRPPESLEAHTLQIGGEQYIVVSFVDPPQQPNDPLTGTERLTESEREIVSLMLRGLSNVEIGRERGTSVRTIANQVT